MKRVVSISLGTSKRDKAYEVDILGVPFRIERIGTDGDRKRFAQLFRELDGQVDALGIGGADLYLVIGERKYTFREVQRLVSGARKTPVVDGSGLKHTLERETVRTLQRDGTVDFSQEIVLMVSAVDRFGMAQALVEAGAHVLYGDLMFGVGVPMVLRSYQAVERVGKLALPWITRMPIQWFYPTGEKQEWRTPKYPKVFEEASMLAGDWHYIRRYAPEDLSGKTILTQTLRAADYAWLRQAGASRVITTTPTMGGETFATNVMEGVLVALSGKRPEQLTPQEYLEWLGRLNWKPGLVELEPANLAAGAGVVSHGVAPE